MNIELLVTWKYSIHHTPPSNDNDIPHRIYLSVAYHIRHRRFDIIHSIHIVLYKVAPRSLPPMLGNL